MIEVEQVQRRRDTRSTILQEVYQKFFTDRNGQYHAEGGLFRTDREYESAFDYLEDKGYITMKSSGGNDYNVVITAAGIDYVEQDILHKNK